MLNVVQGKLTLTFNFFTCDFNGNETSLSSWCAFHKAYSNDFTSKGTRKWLKIIIPIKNDDIFQFDDIEHGK